MNANRKAFLDMLAVSEGTSTSPATLNNGYDVIVTGVDGVPEVFTDYSDHPFNNGRPSKVINSHGLTSNASGRYQFMLRDWHHYRDQLKLPDFSPDSQDLWALQLIRERSALPSKFQDALPMPVVMGIAAVLIVLGVIGRLIEQKPKDPP